MSATRAFVSPRVRMWHWSQTEHNPATRAPVLAGDGNGMLGMLRGDELPPDQTRLDHADTVAKFLWNSTPWTKDDSPMLTDIKPFMVDFFRMARKQLGAKTVDLIDNS